MPGIILGAHGTAANKTNRNPCSLGTPIQVGKQTITMLITFIRAIHGKKKNQGRGNMKLWGQELGGWKF